MKVENKHCPECGGKLLAIDGALYECEGCKSLHEQGKPLYSYQPLYAIQAALKVSGIK